MPALSPCHKLRNKGFKLHTNVVHVHLLSKWINRRSEFDKHFSIKLQPRAYIGNVEFTIIESYHGQKLYYHLINLLNFKWHYNMIILVNRTLIIYISAWWRIWCQGLLFFSSLSSHYLASPSVQHLQLTITIKNIQIKVHIYIYLDLPTASVDNSTGLELTVKIIGKLIVLTKKCLWKS